MMLCGGCCVGNCVVTITVSGCNLGAAQRVTGALVEARVSGITIASGTTNTNGQVILTVPQTTPAGSNTQFVASKSRFNATTTLITTSGTTGGGGITMTPATGYSCQNASNCGTVNTICPDPLLNTLNLTLSSGVKVLTHTTVEWSGTEDRGGVRFKYATFGCGFTYGYCVLGGVGDPTCANAASYSGPSSFTINLPVTCPASGLLVSGTLTSPYDSGSWSITE